MGPVEVELNVTTCALSGAPGEYVNEATGA
jgi:hypothetical protein